MRWTKVIDVLFVKERSRGSWDTENASDFQIFIKPLKNAALIQLTSITTSFIQTDEEKAVKYTTVFILRAGICWNKLITLCIKGINLKIETVEIMQKKLLGAIDVFYDCVGDTFDYGTALKSYSAMAEDSAVALSEIRPLTGKVIVRGSHKIPAEALNGWQPAREKCPQREVLRKALSSIPIHVPVMRRTFVSDEDWQGSLTCKRVAEPWGFHGDGTSLLTKGILKVITCGFARTPEQEEMRADTLVTMAFMNNHLSRAISMQNRISQVEQMLLQSRNVLDLIEFGVVLYGPDKKPVFVNASAQKMFDDEDGMKLNTSGIVLYDSRIQQEFSQLLINTYCIDKALSARSGGMISIPRSSGRTPYTLTIVPMQNSLVGDETVSAVAFIFDPLKKQTTTLKVIAENYGLTRTEAKLAYSLMQGETLEGAAQKRDVSYNTMKTHLHSIFSKTNTNRQVDLVSLLLRSVTGVKLKS